MTTTATIPPASRTGNPDELDDETVVVVVVGRLGSSTTTAVPPLWLRVVGVERPTPFTVAEMPYVSPGVSPINNASPLELVLCTVEKPEERVRVTWSPLTGDPPEL